MHGTGQQLFILAKKAALGDEHPDYSGGSFLDAKKAALAEPDKPDDQPEPDTDKIGSELRDMSSRLCEIATEMGSPKGDDELETYGKKQQME